MVRGRRTSIRPLAELAGRRLGMELLLIILHSRRVIRPPGAVARSGNGGGGGVMLTLQNRKNCSVLGR